MVGVNMNHFDAHAHEHTRIQNKMENTCSVHSGFSFEIGYSICFLHLNCSDPSFFFFQKVTL